MSRSEKSPSCPQACCQGACWPHCPSRSTITTWLCRRHSHRWPLHVSQAGLRQAGAVPPVVPKVNHCLCNCRLLFLSKKLLKWVCSATRRSKWRSGSSVEPHGERCRSQHAGRGLPTGAVPMRGEGVRAATMWAMHLQGTCSPALCAATHGERAGPVLGHRLSS